MEYKLVFGKEFDRDFNKLDNSIKQEAWKKIERLKENPHIGKHLQHLNLWELHVRMYRIFYIVDNNEIRILFLSMKHKDECDRFVRGLSIEDIKRLLSDAF